MALLSTIVSSILRDIIVAQHEANMYAVSLSDFYKKNGRLERFSMPTADIGDIELELRYGVKDDSSKTEQYEINYPVLRKLSKDLSKKIGRTAVESVKPVLQKYYASDTSDESEAVRLLISDSAKKENFSAFLGRKILKSLQYVSTSLINNDGTLNDETLANFSLSTCEEELLHHASLSVMFDKPGGTMVRDEAKEAMEKGLKEMIPEMLKDVNVKRKRLVPSVDVIISSQELASLPDDCVHTIKFNLSTENIRLFTEEV